MPYNYQPGFGSAFVQGLAGSNIGDYLLQLLAQKRMMDMQNEAADSLVKASYNTTYPTAQAPQAPTTGQANSPMQTGSYRGMPTYGLAMPGQGLPSAPTSGVAGSLGQAQQTPVSLNDPNYQMALARALQVNPGFAKLQAGIQENLQPKPISFGPGVSWGTVDANGNVNIKGTTPTKPEPVYLRTEKQTVNGVTKLIDVYGYQTPQGERVTERKASDYTPPASVIGMNTPDDFSKWSQADKDWWFELKLNTGQEPSFGSGRFASESRKQFAQEYAAYARGKGVSGTGAASTAEGFKADSKSLQNIVKASDAILSFEKGVQNSFDLVTRLSNQFSRSKLPGVNTMSQWFKYQAGNPDFKAFTNALTTSMTEYMKVVTAGTGLTTSELSVAAQERAKELLNTADSPETIQKSIDTMRQEMEIKKQAFAKQKAEIQERMRATSTGGNSANTNGKKAITLPDGTVVTEE